MISAFLLAASIITPPHGMGRVPSIPLARAGFLKREGVTMVEQLRGIASTEWDGHWYKTPYYIGVARLDRSLDPAYAAMWELSVRANPPFIARYYSTSCTRAAGCVRTPWKPKPPVVLAFKEISLCNGSRGWLTKLRTGALGDTAVHVYAQSGGNLYEASTQYDKTNGDIFHAEKAVESLCPPGAAPPEKIDPPSQVASPNGWTAVDPTSVPQIGNEMDTRALWAHLSPKTYMLDQLLLAQGSDVDENVTPEQESDFLRQSLTDTYANLRTVSSRRESYCGITDGWYRVLSGVSRYDGYTYRITSESAYYNGTSYELALLDHAEQPDDPAALASLRSFCPKR